MQGQKIGGLVIKKLMKVKKPESMTSQSEFKQVSNDPNYILESISAYIDLIFTSQPKLVMNSGI